MHRINKTKGIPNFQITSSSLNEGFATNCNLSHEFVDDGVYQLDVEKCLVNVVLSFFSDFYFV